jgi:hypothetical protein
MLEMHKNEVAKEDPNFIDFSGNLRFCRLNWSKNLRLNRQSWITRSASFNQSLLSHWFRNRMELGIDEVRSLSSWCNMQSVNAL